MNKGATHDLGTLGGPDAYANGINTAGQVVGESGTPGGGNDHAFYWTSSTGIVDLNTLIDSQSGWELEGAQQINDAGQITGWGWIAGQEHAFLLTPIASPTPTPTAQHLL